jgi:transcriptional regulator GlxA family with amidase domain
VPKKYSVAIVLFEEFEVLDVFGPIEMLGMYPEMFDLHLVAQQAGEISSAQGPRSVVDAEFSDPFQYDILLVPGGRGTRREVDNHVILKWLESQSKSASFITSVCTGSAVLAKAGILDGVRATSNKMSFEWVTTQGPNVEWISQARWVEDGNIFTSSGVSAGMDMTLALINRILDRKSSDDAALWAEYSWHTDPGRDPFAKAWGLVDDC